MTPEGIKECRKLATALRRVLNKHLPAFTCADWHEMNAANVTGEYWAPTWRDLETMPDGLEKLAKDESARSEEGRAA